MVHLLFFRIETRNSGVRFYPAFQFELKKGGLLQNFGIVGVGVNIYLWAR